MSQPQPLPKSKLTPAAAGFHTDEIQPQQETEVEFLFTRAIEFRQETIYFLIIDRFKDGDPSNNEGPNPELFDPTRQQWGKYWGGDLQGVIDQLDYLKNLGITAIWISPVFEQVEHLQFEFAAMHGYWTKDFKRINPRFVANDERTEFFASTVFDRLVTAMHDRGMKLILDIVCNHSSPDVNGHKGELYDNGVLIADYYQDENEWYHHNGEITDWEDQWQLENQEMAGLADFNEGNIEFRNYIKSAIKLWLDHGVDALRVDTVKHMPLWFWQEFTADLQSHKPSIFMFGEWGFSKPWERRSVEFANQSGMSILDFGLCEAIRSAIAQNKPGGFHLIQDVFQFDSRYNTATELITFIDNHDMPRFLSLNPDPAALRLAVNLIMTTRGIPCIYYGTEQYLYNNTQGGQDPYNRPMMEQWQKDTQIYKDLQLFSKLRRLNPAISLGSQIEKYITEEVYCFLRSYRDYRCLVAMNKGAAATFDVRDTRLEDGDYVCILTKRLLTIRNGNLLGLRLAAKEMIVLSYVGERVKGQTIARVQVNGYSTQIGESVVVTGDCPELGNWDIRKAYRLEYINDSTWFGEIPFNETAGRAIAFKYAVVSDHQPPVFENIVCRRWILAPQGTIKWRDTWAR